MENENVRDLLIEIAPGTEMRKGLNRVVSQDHGGLIVLAVRDEAEEVINSGLELDEPFSPERLAEMSKMDGAIVLDRDKDKFLYSNAHLVPDPSITTNETGTRHRTAERVAKQLETFVITVSEERDEITIYHPDGRYKLEDPISLMAEVNQAMLILNQYREDLDKTLEELTTAELAGRVQPRHIKQVLTKVAQLFDVRSDISEMVTELGEKREMLDKRIDNLVEGVEREFENVVEDFKRNGERSTEEIKEEVLEFSQDETLSPDKVLEILGHSSKKLDEYIPSRGTRLLNKLPKIPSHVVAGMVDEFDDLEEMMCAESDRLKEVKGVADQRAGQIEEGFARMQEEAEEKK